MVSLLASAQAAPERLPGEPDKAWAEFLVYLAQGKRKISKTVRITGTGMRTAYRWMRAWDWEARAQAMTKLMELPPEPEPVSALSILRPEDLEALREDCKARLVRAAVGATDDLIQLARGAIRKDVDEGGWTGPKDRNGEPLVKPAVRLAACKLILELSGLTPPKRVEITRPESQTYTTTAGVLARMTPEDASAFREAWRRAKGAVIETTAEMVAKEDDADGGATVRSPA
jgi:hypothetical protein